MLRRKGETSETGLSPRKKKKKEGDGAEGGTQGPTTLSNPTKKTAPSAITRANLSHKKKKRERRRESARRRAGGGTGFRTSSARREARKSFRISKKKSQRVFNPSNPYVPTTHMNREGGRKETVWWFAVSRPIKREEKEKKKERKAAWSSSTGDLSELQEVVRRIFEEETGQEDGVLFFEISTRRKGKRGK